MCAKFVYDKCLTDKRIIIVDTKAGIKPLILNVVGKYVDMGIPKYESECIPVISNTKIANNLKIEILDKIFDVNCVSNGLTSCNVKENFWVVIWIFYIMIIIMYMTGPAMTVFEGKLVDLDVKSFI